MSDSEDIDELDELLGLLDEDEEQEAKEEEKEKEETEKKKSYESELFVYPRCSIRVEPLTRAISFEDLQLRLRRWTYVSLINLPLRLSNKSVISNMVLIGILSFKVIRQSKNGNKYLWIKLDDFKANISCFIFKQEIIEKFYKIQPGTVLCIAAPQILEERKQNNGYKVNTYKQQNISLKIEKFEQILVVGKAKDFSYCGKILKDGHSRCQNIVNKHTSDLCPMHKAQQYKKYASKRNDTNRTSLSRLRKKKSTKSLSGAMNGITMTQRSNMNGFKSRKKPQNTNMHRKQSTDVMPHSMRVRMKKYAKGGKTMGKIEENKKKQEMHKMLSGKTLMPHLGANWGKNSADFGIVLAPKCVQKSQAKAQQIMLQKGIKLDAPNPNDTSCIHRKRSFKEMNYNQEDSNNKPPAKKPRLQHINTKNAEEIINAISLNDTLRKEVNKENVYHELKELEEEEELYDELKTVTSVQVTVYICKFNSCALKEKVCEKPNSFCRSHQQNIVRTSGRKYFWRCSNCNKKTQTLNTKRVKFQCSKCGRRKFVPGSAYNLTKPKIHEEKLILRNNKK